MTVERGAARGCCAAAARAYVAIAAGTYRIVRAGRASAAAAARDRRAGPLARQPRRRTESRSRRSSSPAQAAAGRARRLSGRRPRSSTAATIRIAADGTARQRRPGRAAAGRRPRPISAPAATSCSSAASPIRASAAPTQATVGQYLGEIRLNYNAPDPDLRLYDIDRVEVLEGPQGTLYGAGSLGGIIRIVPNRAAARRGRGHASRPAASLTAHGDPGARRRRRCSTCRCVAGPARRCGWSAMASSEGGYIDDSAARPRRRQPRPHLWRPRLRCRLDADDGWTIDLGASRPADPTATTASMPIATRRR